MEALSHVEIAAEPIIAAQDIITYDARMRLGYPSESFYQGNDPRDDPTVTKAQEQAGKLINQP